MTTNIVAADNPELANEIVDRILSGEAFSTPEPQPATADLPDTHVVLPGGYVTSSGEFVRDAEVRELTGFDEEELSKATTDAKLVQTLLKRAVVKVGELPINNDILDRLLASDRDMLLLAIRKATYGTEIQYRGIRCPHCSELVDTGVDLNKDVPVKRLEDPSDRRFTVALRKGEAIVHLPDGYAQKALSQAVEENKTQAELKTILLRNCVQEINGSPVVDDNAVRKLSLVDRDNLVNEITDRNPGPQLAAVKVPCPVCEEDIELPLAINSLFRF